MAVDDASVELIIPALVRSLESPDADARLKAVQAIESMGPSAKAAVPGLIRALSDPDRKVRGHAGRALVNIGQPAVGQLLQASQSADRITRTEAEIALREIEKQPAPQGGILKTEAEKAAPKIEGPISVSKLVKALQNRDAEYRRQAVELVEAKTPDDKAELISVLVHVAVRDADPAVRYAAAWRLAQLGEAPASSLILTLGDPDPIARAHALDALGEIGPATKAVIPAVVEALADPKVRREAVDALAKIGGKAVPALVRALRSETLYDGAGETLLKIGELSAPALTKALASDETRGRASDVLVAIGPPAVPALIQGFRDGGIRPRADAIVRIGAPAVPALVSALASKETNVRQGAALTLCDLGPAAPEGLDDLLAMIKKHPDEAEKYPVWKFGAAGAAAFAEASIDDLPQIRFLGISNLAQLRPMPRIAYPAYIRTLNDGDSRIRDASALALAEMGDEAIPSLAEALESQEIKIRRAAAEALGLVGAPARKALNPLRRALRDEDPGVRKRAAYAIGQLGPEAKPAAADLVESLADAETHWWAVEALEKIGPASVGPLERALRSESDLRFHAAFVLAAIAPEAEGVPGILLGALTAADAEVRYRAAMALGKNPDSARHTVYPLIRVLKDADEGVRFAAAYALARLSPESVGPLLETAVSAEKDHGVGQALDLLDMSALPALIRALRDPEAAPVSRRLLVRFGPRAVPPLIEALEDEVLQKEAIEALVAIRAPAVPALVHAARAGKTMRRKGAVQALKLMKTPPASRRKPSSPKARPKPVRKPSKRPPTKN